MKRATRVDLVFYNTDGETWTFEFVDHAVLRHVLQVPPDCAPMTNQERSDRSQAWPALPKS